MRIHPAFAFFCLLLFACLAGCMYANPSGTPVATTPSPAGITTPPTVVSGTVITAVPVTELARIGEESLGVPSGTGSVYQFRGSLSISGGAYTSVKAVMHYPDGTEYVFDAGAMGGSKPVVKSIILYPDSRYQDQTPVYFIRLDGKEYATTYQYTDGTIYRVATTDSAVPGSPS
jgi:hypothetical protein